MTNENVKAAKPLLNNQSALTVSACGKTILVGEHAVLYGAKAISLPVSSARLQLDFRLRDDFCKSPKITIGDSSEGAQSSVRPVLMRACELLGVSARGLDVVGRSRLPLGAGFGSSAALCVAILRGLSKLKGLKLTDSDIAKLANRLEERFHGKPSGVDTATISYETCIQFVMGHEPKVLQTKSGVNWPFVLIDSGVKSSTKVMIQAARPYFQGGLGAKRVAMFDRLAGEVESGLSTGAYRRVASAMNEASLGLSEAGVVTDMLQSMIHTLREFGCLGAKITGAGGGGAILALLDPSSQNQQYQAIIDAYGVASVFDVGFHS